MWYTERFAAKVSFLLFVRGTVAERRPRGGAWALDDPDGIAVDKAGAEALSSGLLYANELPDVGRSFAPEIAMAPRVEASPDVSSPSKLSEGRKFPDVDPVDEVDNLRLW